MISLSHVKLKYRLLLVIFLPPIVLLGFITHYLWNDYYDLQQKKDSQVILRLAQKLSELTQSLMAERGMSKISISFKENDYDGELRSVRNRADKQIADIKLFGINAKLTSGAAQLKQVMQQFSTGIDGLGQKRVLIDERRSSNRPADAIDILPYFQKEVDSCVKAISQLSELITDLPALRALYAIAALEEERLSNGIVRVRVFEALSTNKMPQDRYASLEQEVGKQQAFAQTFLNITSNEDEIIYRNALGQPSYQEANQMLSTVLSKGTEGNYNLDPNVWWKIQSDKMKAQQGSENAIIQRSERSFEKSWNAHSRKLLITIISTITILSVTLLLVLLNFRVLTRRLQDEVRVLTVSGEKISQSVTNASAGTSQTAAAVTETTASIEELKQTAEIASDRAKAVAQFSEEALKTLSNTEDSVQKTIEGMNHIQISMGGVTESISKLSEHITAISEIINAVTDFAEQSHLLAINAALEASRAGEQGRGFAVVAQEVGKLAIQSKEATIQVRNILSMIQIATSKAVMVTEQGSNAATQGFLQSNQTNEAIQALSTEINKVAKSAAQISMSSLQQLIGAKQVAIAMMDIREASNHHASQMKTIEGGICGLNEVGQSLKELVQEYKL